MVEKDVRRRTGWDLADGAEGLWPEGWDADRLGRALLAAPAPDAAQPAAGIGAAAAGPAVLTIGSDVEMARLLHADLQREFGPVVHAEGELWRYDGRRWCAIEPGRIRLAAHRYDGALYGRGSTVKLNKTRVDSILHELAAIAADPEFFAEPAVGINCASGFIRFDEDFTPRLVAHSPDHQQRHVLAGRWDPSVPFELPEGSLLHRLLHGCFKGDEDAGAKADLLQEVAGVIVTGRATRLRKPKAVILKGDSAENGKSQVLDMFRALVPKGAATAISPRRFNDGRYVVKLAGRLLNAPDELGGEAIAGEEFKKAVTGNEIVARDVYKSSVEFKPMALHICATNVLPPFRGGMDRGVRRRLLVIEFNRVIPEEERIEDIGARIGREEADLLLAWAIEGAKRVLKRRAFAEPEASRAALAEWVLGADMVLAWLEDEGEIDYGEFKPDVQGAFNPVRTREAYTEFRLWAETEERQDPRKVPDINGFTQRVLAAGKPGVGHRRTKDGRFFTGFALRRCRRLPSHGGWR